jgi:hypothetical protein
MALENEEELQRAMADLTRSMQGLGTDTAVADNELTKFSKSVSSVGSAMAGAAGQVMKGGGAFSSLNGAIDIATKALGGIVGAIPVIGGAAKEFAQGVGEAAKFVMNQLDDLAKNYNALGESGALAADGIDGVQRQFKQMGLVSLPTFTKVINQNTVGMTAFGGSVAEGAEQFSKLAGQLTTGDIGAEFVKLGMSFDGVGESAGKYISTFSRLGLTQGKTFEELKKSTQDYILEVDQISRITGATRKQQEEEQQKNLANAKFRAMIFEMQNNGQEKQAAQMEQYVNGLTGPMADAARASLTGISTTKEAVQLDMVLNGAMTRNIAALKNGASAQEALADINKSSLTGAKNYAGIMKYSGDIAGGAGAQLFDMAQMGKRQLEIQEATGMSAEAAAKQAQDELKNNQGATKEFATAQQKVAGASKDLQELSFNLVKNVVPAVDAFAGSIKRVTGFINEKFGGPPPPKSGAGAPASKQDLKDLITGGKTGAAMPAPIGLGAVAAQFESGAGGAGTISTGKGDLGGKSYGAFQLAGRGGAKGNEVEQFLKASGFEKAFEGLTVGTADFDKKWKDIAATNKDFMASQQKYAAQTHYDPQMAKLKGAGIDLSGKGIGVQEAVMSTANQYGANTSNIIKALQGKDVGKMDDKAIINAIQDFKAQNVASNFKSSSADVQAGVAKRIEQERLALLAAGTKNMGQTIDIARQEKERQAAMAAGPKNLGQTADIARQEKERQAAMATGPKNGFQPQLANATPATTLPPAQQAQANNNQTSTEVDMMAIQKMQAEALNAIARTNQQQLAEQKKTNKQLM